MKIKLYYPFLEVNQAFEIGEADVSERVIAHVASGMKDISFVLIPQLSVQKRIKTIPATEQVHRIIAKVFWFRSVGKGWEWVAVLNDHNDRRKVRTLKGEWIAR